MNGRIGQDPDEVDRLAADLETRAGELIELGHAVTGRLAATVWTGPDRDRFESEWLSSTAPLLARVAEALSGAAERAVVDAQDQRLASGAA